MKKLSPSVAKVAAITGLMLGAFALSVLAANVWTEAECAPPNCNTYAPLNVGPIGQGKEGGLAIGLDQLGPVGNRIFDVHGISRFFADIQVAGTVQTAGLQVADSVNPLDAVTPNTVLTNKGDGTAQWAAPYVPQTQAVSCTDVGNTSYISLNGNNSGNDGAILVNVGALPAGTYTISGTGISTYNVGGGGAAGVFVDSTANLTTGSLGSKLPYLVGATTGGTDASYKMYYKSDYANTVFMLKRSGYNDLLNFNVPSTTFTLGETTYVYIYLAQAAISGSLTINGSKSICSGGGGSTAAPLTYTGIVEWTEYINESTHEAQFSCGHGAHAGAPTYVAGNATTGTGYCRGTGEGAYEIGCSDGNSILDYVINGPRDGNFTAINHKGYCVTPLSIGGSGGGAIPPSCSNGQALTYSNGSYSCVGVSGSGTGISSVITKVDIGALNATLLCPVSYALVPNSAQSIGPFAGMSPGQCSSGNSAACYVNIITCSK